MKTLLTIIASIILFAVTNAQTTTTKNTKHKTTTTTKTKPAKVKDCFKMSDNMMLVVKNGVTTTMSVDTHLKNGTVVKTDGTIVPLKSPSFKLLPGQSIDANGKVSGGAKKKS